MTSTEAEKKLQELMGSLSDGFEDTKKSVATEAKGGFADEKLLSLKDDGLYVGHFFPPSNGRKNPWVKKFVHYFKSASTGQLVSFDCPSTAKKPCKICKNNSIVWNSGGEANKELVRKKGWLRKDAYYSNFYVKESKVAEDVGRVKVYRFGHKIHEKLTDALSIHGMFYAPTDKGSDFVIVKKTTKSGEDNYPNYDSSTFKQNVPMADTPAEILNILSQAHDLSSYEFQIDENDPDLSIAFNEHVLGGETATFVPAKKAAPVAPEAAKDELPDYTPTPSAPAPKESEDESEEDFMRSLKAQLDSPE